MRQGVLLDLWISLALISVGTAAHAESIEMICHVKSTPRMVARHATPIDYYYIIDTTASTVSDRSRNPGTYPAQISAATVDWQESGERYYLDRDSGHMTFYPAQENLMVDWECRRAQRQF